MVYYLRTSTWCVIVITYCLFTIIVSHFDSFHGSSSLIDFFLVRCKEKIVASNQFLVPPIISKDCLITLQYLVHSDCSDYKFSYGGLKHIHEPTLLESARALGLPCILLMNHVDDIAISFNNNIVFLLDQVAPIPKILWQKVNSVGVGGSKRIRVPPEIDINEMNKHFLIFLIAVYSYQIIIYCLNVTANSLLGTLTLVSYGTS